MLAAFFQKLGPFSRRFLPAATTLVLALAGALLWPLPFVGAVMPPLSLIAIYYWSIYRPDLLSPLFVFLVGLLHDSLHFLPLGLSAFVFVGLRQLSFSQRRFFVGQTFFMLWSGFALVAFLFALVNWCVLSLLAERALTIFPVFVQLLLLVAVFPLFAWVLIRLQRNLLSQA